jgi:uncharacterized protein
VSARDTPLEAHHVMVAALQRSLGADTQRIETHISTLLLAGEYAYKLRKPLALAFLDFSTAPRRRHDCEEELRLNRRTAPQLYLDVLPVLGPAAQARVGRAEEGAGAIDWLLRMRRFDNEGLLDRLASRGALTQTHVDALARRVAAFHDGLPASPAAYGDPQAVLAWARANFDALGAQAPAELRDWTEREFVRVAPALALRRAQGRVREGHGDLHLGNIVLVDGEPLPFDGIEFNAALRHTDTMADVAFAFMDLWRHGLPRLAWRFASGCAEHGGDYAGLALLPFFAVYRAMVRAQVAALRAAQADSEPALVQARAALARDLGVAGALSRLRQACPLLVLTSGLSGSGKSTVALDLLQSLGAVRLRSDVERKRLAGVAATARPTAAQAQRLYSLAMNTRTYAWLQSLARELLRAGLHVVVDAAALRRHERDGLRALARGEGARFALVECDAPQTVLRERITRRLAANHDASDATLEVLDFQLSVREPVGVDEAALRLSTDCDADLLAQRCETLAAALLRDGPAAGELPPNPDRGP